MPLATPPATGCRIACLLLSVIALSPFSFGVTDVGESGLVQKPVSGRALRAANYEEALALAKTSGGDIVVLQRGSDWNILGERVYNDLWLKEDFAKTLGEGFVLVAIDKQETPGSPPVTGFAESRVGSNPSLRLAKIAADTGPLPPNEISSVVSQEKIVYAKRADGTFAVNPKEPNNPAKDTLTLTLNAIEGGNILRLDFPTDPALPGNGPGRASNGNFALSEVEVAVDGHPIKAEGAWSEYFDGRFPPSMAVDGVSDVAEKSWNAHGEMHRRRTLLVALAEPVKAGAVVTVRLICKTIWDRHVPGTLRASVIDTSGIRDDLLRITAAQTLASKNAGFDWMDNAHFPRIALLDTENRAVACDKAPRPKSVDDLVGTVMKLRAVRTRRDALWAKAAAQTGPAKAELLRQGLDAMGIANWPGNHNAYADIHKQIREADPQDASGAVRWLGFGGDPRQGCPWAAKPNWNEIISKPGATDADFLAALATVDAELKDPRNRVLTHEQIQRFMLAKFSICKRWPGHEEQRFDIQREIAAYDPDTIWGIGARGYLGMHKKTPVPMLTYGWAPGQLKGGAQVWKITDTDNFFDHAGPYTLSLHHAGGADTVQVTRVSVMDGETVLASGAPAQNAAVGPGKNVTIPLDIPGWKPGRKLTLRVEISAKPGKTDNAGTFAVMPEFAPPPGWSAPKPPSIADSTLPSRPDLTEWASWQKNLRSKLSDTGSLRGAALNLALARTELVRACGTDKIAALAKADGGAAFLATFMNDTEWMESFLTSGPANFAQSLENLRFLWCQEGKSFDTPLFKRIATTMSLLVGETYPRYRLLDRYRHTRSAWNLGLLHAGYANLPMHLMRFATYMAGNAKEYQYLLDDRQTTQSDYLGACWSIEYIDTNVYGDSVQTGEFIGPWTHHFGPGNGDRPLAACRAIGGVCGTLSSYGASVATAHGVPATTVGQPGHCAYVVQLGDEWPLSNDVFGPGATNFSVPGWEGTGYSTAMRLWAPVEANREAFMAATRLAWLAHARLDKRPPGKGGDTGWRKHYETAILAEPTNYGIWLDYVKALEATPAAIDAAGWAGLAKTAAASLRSANQAGFAMAQRCAGHAFPKMTPDARVELLLAINSTLRQENWVRPVGYDGIHNNFTWQAEQIGDPKLEVPFFAKLLEIHHDAKPENNWIFNALMAWGANRFSAKPTASVAYATAMEKFMNANGRTLGGDFKSGMIVQNLRKACEAGDLSGYRQWSLIASRLLPPVKPADIHLNAAQIAAAPKITPFTGSLLSRDGLLRTSSVCQYDRPLSYRAVLDGSAPGYFDTNGEEKPWAEVCLPGEAEISGIVLVNRYEFEPEKNWAVPLKISTSTDGKTWTEVALIEKAEDVIRIDLRNKIPRAHLVRIERLAPADGSKAPANRFHFRNFLVYGRPLH